MKQFIVGLIIGLLFGTIATVVADSWQDAERAKFTVDGSGNTAIRVVTTQ